MIPRTHSPLRACVRGATAVFAVRVRGAFATAVLAVGMSGAFATAAAAAALSVPTLNPLPPPLPPPLPVATAATITPSLLPDRAGAKAALTFTIRYAGGEFGVPSQVRHSILRLPQGMSLEIPRLRACRISRLRAHGPKGCPVQSEIGSGHALAETHAGSQITTEEVDLHAFLGPPENLQPTFVILAQGHTPLDEQIVFTGKVSAAGAPYGEQLEMSIPPVPSLPLEPDASIVMFSLTVGAVQGHGASGRSTISVPRKCPSEGFPFAAEFTYADGSSGGAVARVPCPGSSIDNHASTVGGT